MQNKKRFFFDAGLKKIQPVVDKLLILVILAGLSACSLTPDLTKMTDRKSISYSRIAKDSSRLGQYVNQLPETEPEHSGVSVLKNGMDAFLARALLIKAADDSLDLQYYIWKDDATGRIILSLLLEAADRGVRIRLLIDDVNTAGKDQGILTLHQHPNIEVRLFNPFYSRSSRLWSFLTDFNRLNHRMHNKLFIADGKIAILGGRNIGDEYFDASKNVEFSDLDLFAVGPVVGQSGRSFDDFWNSPAAVPADALIALPTNLAEFQKQLNLYRDQQSQTSYAIELRQRSLFDDLLNHQVQWFWGEGKILADQTSKINSPSDESRFLATQLRQHINDIRDSLLIISPYFVPNDVFMNTLDELVSRGVKISVLTNSLTSTDVSIVHAGYQKYRHRLLQMGVNLYELKPASSNRKKVKKHQRLKDIGGSSRASLHAKIYIFDTRRLFTGSLNLDPRSVYINTEIGLLMDNPLLAAEFEKRFFEEIEDDAYRLELDDHQKINWITRDKGEPRVFTREPGLNPFKALGMWFISLFPIEEQL